VFDKGEGDSHGPFTILKVHVDSLLVVVDDRENTRKKFPVSSLLSLVFPLSVIPNDGIPVVPRQGYHTLGHTGIQSIRNFENCRYHQTNSMDPGGPQQNVTESRGDPSSPCLQEGIGKVAKGAHAEKRERKYLGRTEDRSSELLEDKEIWGNETTLRGVIYDSRKRERSNEEGLFMTHQKGPITSTFTGDWFLREGQGRELLGEWIRVAAPEWKFLYVSGEKCLQTVWDEITSDFEDIQYLNLTQETIWNAARVREMTRPITSVV
jgi:hypothetical protein